MADAGHGTKAVVAALLANAGIAVERLIHLRTQHLGPDELRAD